MSMYFLVNRRHADITWLKVDLPCWWHFSLMFQLYLLVVPSVKLQTWTLKIRKAVGTWIWTKPHFCWGYVIVKYAYALILIYKSWAKSESLFPLILLVKHDNVILSPPITYGKRFIFRSQNVLGTWSSKLFAIALLASGQSSTITGTYAGQYVMQVW